MSDAAAAPKEPPPEIKKSRIPGWALPTLRVLVVAAIGFLAWELIRANQSRIALTRREARSESIAQLRSFARRHRAANAAVEMRVKALRKALHLPPPSTS